MKYSRLTLLSHLTAVSMLASCSGYKLPPNVDLKPRQEPSYNFSQSSRVLSCLGKRISQIDRAPVDIFIADIPDHTVPAIDTGFLTKNSVMMVTTSVDRLGTPKVSVIGRNGGIRGHSQVQILGSFTELNRTTRSSAINGQMVLPGGIDLDFGADRNYNHIALDLAMSENNRIISGTSTSVSIQISGESGDATITYDEGNDFAVTTAVGLTGQEGFHAAQRLLVETSVALMMSKYYKIDIATCLGQAKRDDAAINDSLYDKPIFTREQEEGVNNVQEEQSYEPVYIQRRNRTAVQKKNALKSFITERNIYIDKEREEVIKLPEQNGVVVLPRDFDPRFLRKQPDYYEIKRGQDSSIFEEPSDSSPTEPTNSPLAIYPKWGASVK